MKSTRSPSFSGSLALAAAITLSLSTAITPASAKAKAKKQSAAPKYGSLCTKDQVKKVSGGLECGEDHGAYRWLKPADWKAIRSAPEQTRPASETTLKKK